MEHAKVLQVTSTWIKKHVFLLSFSTTPKDSGFLKRIVPPRTSHKHHSSIMWPDEARWGAYCLDNTPSIPMIQITFPPFSAKSVYLSVNLPAEFTHLSERKPDVALGARDVFMPIPMIQ